MIRYIFTYVTLILYIWGLYYLGDFIGVGYFLIAILGYSLLFYLVYVLVKRAKIQWAMSYLEFLDGFIYRMNTSIFIVLILLGSFSVYQNEVNPAKMPIYTVTNGEKTIVFQNMSHIGTQAFYDQVKEQIIERKKEGYVLFFEGVRPGTEENAQKFNEAIGFNFDKDTYAHISKLYNLVNQNNDDFLGLVNDQDYNIDLSMDEIIKYYEEAQLEYEATGSWETQELPIDISKDVIALLSELNDRQLQVLVYINRSIMNYIIKNDTVRQFIANNVGNEQLFEVILKKRNENLYHAIMNSQHDKIIIMYGLLHYEGVFHMLSSFDPNWQRTSTVDLYPIRD